MKNAGMAILGWSVGLGLAAAGIFGIVAACESHQNGIYGGTSYGDAKNRVANILVHRYGVPLTRSFHYNGEEKSHLLGEVGGGQVRIFHFTGPKGSQYCVSLWDEDTNIRWQAQKGAKAGCKF